MIRNITLALLLVSGIVNASEAEQFAKVNHFARSFDTNWTLARVNTLDGILRSNKAGFEKQVANLIMNPSLIKGDALFVAAVKNPITQEIIKTRLNALHPDTKNRLSCQLTKVVGALKAYGAPAVCIEASNAGLILIAELKQLEQPLMTSIPAARVNPASDTILECAQC